MKSVDIEIESISPILINRFKVQEEVPVKSTRGKKDYGTPREQAEETLYCDEKTDLCWIPSSWIKGAMTAVASDYKLSGTRKSVKSVIGGAVIPSEEKLYFNEGYKVKDCEVDSRPCVIQRARIMRHRARFEEWSFKFSLEIEDAIIPVETVQQLLEDCGRRAGLGDFRSQKGGPFGRFAVTNFKIQNKKTPLTKTKRTRSKMK